MTDTSFRPSLRVLRAIDLDFKDRLRAIETEHEDKMEPLRSEFSRARNEAERHRKSKIEKAKRWRDNMVRRAGGMPVESLV